MHAVSLQDMDDDALSIGKIWSVNYFFYNKQLKKLAFFACWIKSKIRGRVTDEGEEMDRFLPICFGAKPLSCPICHEHALVASQLSYRFRSTAAIMLHPRACVWPSAFVATDAS